ncbi:type 1 glutamine amidotransferase family protein [Rubeoparvulum massiliense]|uniref:type 1 glutamine amidotransferase family protein n=1 Tax=Rubeoparvulum massiliense TaxID=1631346 RepID=UPI00065E6BC6|nr:type 1 glutamine amidotransferase family protein [Rubeoparvulum massiliense]
MKNEILLLLTDKWCDWEASYAVAVANAFSDYMVKTISVDTNPKISMGNLCTSVDYSITNFDNYSNVAMVILPGGLSWEENDYDEIAEFIKNITQNHIPVAAICGATTFLCKHGFLDTVKHTGDSLELFQSQKGYNGQSLYIPAQVVVDGGFITANETAAVEFAYEIFKILKLDSEDELAQWYDNFNNGAIRRL